MIGGGIGGAVKEILKHPVEKLYYVEINPFVIEAARKFFSHQLEGPLSDPRVEILNLDGRYFIKHPPTKLDTVIIDTDSETLMMVYRGFTTLRDSPHDLKTVEISP